MGSAPTEPAGRRIPLRLSVQGALALVLWVASVTAIVAYALAVTHTANRAGDLVGLGVSLVVLVLSSRWAMYVEHRMRADYGPALAADMVSLIEKPVTFSSLFNFHRTSRPISTLSGGASVLTFGGVAILTLAAAITTIGQANQSSYTQHHGIRRVAILESVSNSRHCDRHGVCYWTGTARVRLSPPVDGATTSVVHTPAGAYGVRGEPEPVLVDPRQPGYAEYRGKPFKRRSDWTWQVGIAALFAALTAVDLFVYQFMLSFRCEWRARQAAGAGDARA